MKIVISYSLICVQLPFRGYLDLRSEHGSTHRQVSHQSLYLLTVRRWQYQTCIQDLLNISLPLLLGTN